MKTKIAVIATLVVFLGTLAACGESVDLEATSTAVAGDIAATQAAEAAHAEQTADAQAAMDAEATVMAEVEKKNAEARATLDANATAAAEVEAQATEAEFNRVATETAMILAATERMEGTATARAVERSAMTAIAEPMVAMINDLHAEGYLASSEGQYFALEDFTESWAQLNWYQWWGVGHEAPDFVIRADVDYISASDTADWWASGCGFVFRTQNVDNHYRAFLALDGNVRFNAFVNGNYVDLGKGYYGKPDLPGGGAEIMLVMEGDMMTFFVDGERVYGRQYGALDDGYLAITLASGTNKGLGTTCSFRNIDLWEIET